jgi:hypothetical protein
MPGNFAGHLRSDSNTIHFNFYWTEDTVALSILNKDLSSRAREPESDSGSHVHVEVALSCDALKY